MASISGFRFDISGASGSQGFLSPKESWRAYVFPRGGYASQASTGTLITFDDATVASRFAANDWLQVGLSVDNIRQVSAVGGNSLSVSGDNVTVAKNDRIFLIGTTQPSTTGGSATYTVPNTLIYQRDDDGSDLYTNSMITSNSNGLIQGFANANFFDILIQDSDQTNQGSIVDIEVGNVGGVSASNNSSFGANLAVDGDFGVTGHATFGSTVTFNANIGWTGSVTDPATFGSTVTINGEVDGMSFSGTVFRGKDEPYVNVMHPDFGVTRDGVTDDLTGISAALNYAATGTYKNTVFFPAGNYLISNTLFIPAGVVLLGEGAQTNGTRITLNGDFNGFEMNHDGIGIRNMAIVRGDNSYASSLIKIEANASNIWMPELRDLYLKGGDDDEGGTGIEIAGQTKGVIGPRVSRVYFERLENGLGYSLSAPGFTDQGYYENFRFVRCNNGIIMHTPNSNRNTYIGCVGKWESGITTRHLDIRGKGNAFINCLVFDSGVGTIRCNSQSIGTNFDNETILGGRLLEDHGSFTSYPGDFTKPRSDWDNAAGAGIITFRDHFIGASLSRMWATGTSGTGALNQSIDSGTGSNLMPMLAMNSGATARSTATLDFGANNLCDQFANCTFYGSLRMTDASISNTSFAVGFSGANSEAYIYKNPSDTNFMVRARQGASVTVIQTSVAGDSKAHTFQVTRTNVGTQSLLLFFDDTLYGTLTGVSLVTDDWTPIVIVGNSGNASDQTVKFNDFNIAVSQRVTI